MSAAFHSDAVVVTADQADTEAGYHEIVDEVEQALRKKARKLDMSNGFVDDPQFTVIGFLDDEARMVPALARLLREYDLADADLGDLTRLLAVRFPSLKDEAWTRLRRQLETA